MGGGWELGGGVIGIWWIKAKDVVKPPKCIE